MGDETCWDKIDRQLNERRAIVAWLRRYYPQWYLMHAVRMTFTARRQNSGEVISFRTLAEMKDKLREVEKQRKREEPQWRSGSLFAPRQGSLFA